MGVDIKAVAAHALAMAEVLLPEWIGGRREGHEWAGLSRAQGGLGNSWKVNLTNGVWKHFGGEEKGGDLIDLYATLHHLTPVAAAEEVAKIIGHTGVYVPVLPPVKPPQKRPEPIPAEPPPVPACPGFGDPVAAYRYGDSFVVARYERDGKKQFRQWTWREGGWRGKAPPAPRELYQVLQLQKHPTAPVLIVEGEKCVESARGPLRAFVLLTWSGGAGSAKQSDWTPLAGREVYIWPDADAPGREAAATIASLLLPIAARVCVVEPPADVPNGWDVADALASGWDARRCTDHIKASKPTLAPAEAAPAAARIEAAPDDPEPSAVVDWQMLGLDCNQGGVPHPTMANASLIVRMHPELKGRIWLDSFRGRIYHTLRGPTAMPWTDADTRKLTVMVQQTLHLPKMTTRLMLEAIEHAAEVNAKNSLVEWLDSLVWDGEPRLDTWLIDCLGVEFDDYTQAIARNWPIAMVARAYRPGCKMDNMPVLEGVSGLSKTTFLEVLGDPWYKSLPHLGFGDKDFLQAIQGAWLIEIPDMTNFSRREHAQIIATITTRTDSYRASYGRFTEDHPRTAMFAATSENDDYLQDLRGKRRYWPLRCEAIDIDCLRRQREQIFAEAAHCYRHGESWFKMPPQASKEQEARAEADPWTDRVLDYVVHACDQRGRVLMGGILSHALEIPIAKQSVADQRRVARILREAGWMRARTTDSRYWTKPQRK